MIFADIILPVPVPQLFTYLVDLKEENSIQPGKRVVVRFGKSKIYTGIVRKVHKIKPDYETKKIISVIDEIPILSELHFKFWEWLAEYYMCTLGEVFKAALPSGLKPESSTNLIFNKKAETSDKLSDKQNIVLDIIETNKIISISKIRTFVDFDVFYTVKTLIEKKLIFVEEFVQEKYKIKKEVYIRKPDELDDENKLLVVLDNLKKAPKQQELLMSFIYLCKYGSDKFTGLKPTNEFLRSDTIKYCDTTSGTLNALIDKNILVSIEREVGRLGSGKSKYAGEKILNEFQVKAQNEIAEQFENKDIVLLHGVTSSGKTEIYIKLIEQELKKGKQVLYLLPEIALTAQIINRLKEIFGDSAGVYHSKFSDAERVEIWNNLQENNINKKYRLILGVRSSIFLPFDKLGLIIIDEEHENTYKQFNPAPRYNARDSSLVLAKLHGAKVLLGTATPSVESYYNAQSAKYGLVELFHRHKDISMPEMFVSDIRQATKRKMMNGNFSPMLLQGIKNALDNKEQVILFQNRRGFSPFLECETCGWIPKCEHCDVSLTFHKHNNQLVCHYCGFSYEKPLECLACGSVTLQNKGFGTEKIEEEIEHIFPGITTDRMDIDSTRSMTKYRKIISEFESGKTNILIGTQMVSKGLDFDNVALVGVMNADNLLNFPDFRAFERTFQLITQVSGRAGRRNKRGTVIIQTGEPKHHIIKAIVENDFKAMYQSECELRNTYKYPPFYRLISISLRHKDKTILDKTADYSAKLLRSNFGNRLLGPEYPLISKIQNYYIKTMLLKLEKDKSASRAKQIIKEVIINVLSQERFKSVNFVIDVDPM